MRESVEETSVRRDADKVRAAERQGNGSFQETVIGMQATF